MKMTHDDRRRFFRITDSIGVSYKHINEEDDNASEKVVGSVHDALNASELLEFHNQALNKALSDLDGRDSLAATAISALNRKIDAVISLMEIDGLQENKVIHNSVQEASISACGIAFPVAETISSQAMLELTLYLETSGEKVVAIGKVIECEKGKDDDSFYIRVEFTEMSEREREKLIQHIVLRQGSLLRSIKQQFE